MIFKSFNRILLLLLWLPVISMAENVPYPTDVQAFIGQRDGCNHFRGEPDFNEERRQFLIAKMQQYCTGTDAQLAALKHKYQHHQAVSAKLAEYEDNIELNLKLDIENELKRASELNRKKQYSFLLLLAIALGCCLMVYRIIFRQNKN